jgi:16S rRNA (adenine1518-N6/adenine1519-N6)-dimethyltransferase
LSVGVQSLCRVENLFGVPAGAFHPPPKVRSAVVRLRPLVTPLVAPVHAEAFRTFVTACFSRRRKQLRNVLSAVTGRPADEVVAWLESLGIARSRRPETLSPEQFIQLFHGRGDAADLRGGDRL